MTVESTSIGPNGSTSIGPNEIGSSWVRSEGASDTGIQDFDALGSLASFGVAVTFACCMLLNNLAK